MSEAALAYSIVAGMGHNNPPNPIELLRDELTRNAAKLVQRRDELIAAAGRVPEAIETEEVAGRAGDFIKQLTAAHKATEAARVAAKEPHLEAGRVVDGFFKQLTDPLTQAKKAIEARLGSFLKKKADEERRKREEAAKLERDRAQREWEAAEQARKAAEALKQADLKPAAAQIVENHIDAATEHEQRAVELQREAQTAKVADLSRVRGDYGSVQSLRTTPDFEVLDIHEIPLEAIRPYLPIAAIETAVRGFVKTLDQATITKAEETQNVILPGVRIFLKHGAVVR